MRRQITRNDASPKGGDRIRHKEMPEGSQGGRNAFFAHYKHWSSWLTLMTVFCSYRGHKFITNSAEITAEVAQVRQPFFFGETLYGI